MRKLWSWSTVVVLVFAASGGSVSAFPSGGALPPALTLVVQVAGLDGVPVDAVGVAMNVTVTSPAGPGFLTVYPCGEVPPTSNLNYAQDQTVPNFVVSGLSPDGEVCIDTFAIVDVVVDLAGYIPGGSPIVMLPQPSRIVDSRQGIGLPGPMTAVQVAEVQVAGAPGVPVDASMVLFNATVTNPATAGFLTVFPCGESIPPTSTLNFVAGSTVPNFVVAKIGTAGRICLYSTSRTEVIVDVAGYVPAGVSDVVPLGAPARLLDTRNGIGGPPGKVTATGRAVQLAGMAGIPDTATAVLVNLTATLSSASGYVSAYPCGGAAPLVSNLNFSAGADVANMAIVKLGATGELCLTSNNDVDVIADVTGYLNSDASITALTPARIYDSREGVDPACNLGLYSYGEGYLIYALPAGNTIGSLRTDGVQSSRAFIRDDCRTIDVVGFVPSLGQNRGWVYDALASPFNNLIESYQLPGDYSRVMFTDHGPTILQRLSDGSGFYAQLVDVGSGIVLLTVSEPDQPTEGNPRIWQPVGATLDGGLIALQLPAVDSSRTIVSYWTSDGQHVGEWTSPVGASGFRLSPAGSYLAYVIPTGPGTTDGFVVTLDGSRVTTMPPAPVVIGSWLTDGSMLGCTRRTTGQMPVRWDLFSPVKDLIPSDTHKACLSVAR